MKFEDLSMTLEQVADFIEKHDMLIEDNERRDLGNEGLLEYLKANKNKISFKPHYYYGDSITGIQIEETIDGSIKKYDWTVRC